MWVGIRVAAIAAVFLLGTCDKVQSRAPVGRTPVIAKEQIWNGTWVSGLGTRIAVRVLDAEEGLLEIGGFQLENDHLVSEILEAQLFRHNGVMFASIRDPEEPEFYLWARAHRFQEQLIFWLPDHQMLSELVRAEMLPGTVYASGEVVIDPLQEAQLDLLTNANMSPFNWAEPLALIRTSERVR